MNVDSQLPTTPIAAYAARPVKSNSDQASARPVDRPHHTEPSNNQQKGESVPSGTGTQAEEPRAESSTVRQDSESNQQEKREVEQFPARAHEAPHGDAAGSHALAETKGTESSATARTGFSSNPTQPAPIGDLLDVIA